MPMKHMVFMFLMLLVAVEAGAQEKREDFTPSRFQAELEQYITKKACLTPKEAAEFFPLYDEMRRKQRSIHKEMRRLKRVKPATDADCIKNIRKRDEYEIEMKEIQRTYHNKFMEVLPAKKVYDVLNAEDRFHRQMFKKSAHNGQKKK